MGNESCCSANNDNNEGKVMNMDDMIAKRQLSRTPVPVLAEKSVSDLHASAIRQSASAADLEEKGETKLSDGSLYKGQWKGQVKHGKGVLTYPDGAVYHGNFELLRGISRRCSSRPGKNHTCEW